MNNVQKDFIHTLALKDHVEKDVVITGPVGSGKTLLALESINIKMSYYKKKYGLECQSKLRIIILIEREELAEEEEENMLKQQILKEMSKSAMEYSLEIVIGYWITSGDLTSIFQDDVNYRNYSHTIFMMDEIFR